MNKPYIRLAATFATALALVSCQKGDLLNVVQDDIELNENTAQYQEFIKERVTDYARAYRFEQARANLPKLTDEANRREGQRIIDFYHAKALKDGFAYILSSGDSLFLKMKNEENLPPEQITGVSQFMQYPEFKGLGQDVTLWGIANFPNTERIYITEAQITKILDLDKLSKLREVHLMFKSDNFDYGLWFPNRPFRPVDISGYDFSKNNAIEWMELEGCNITSFKGPEKPLPMLYAKRSIYSASTINTLNAYTMKLEECDAQEPDLKLTNPNLHRLTIYAYGDEAKRLRSLDVSASRLTYLSFNQGGEKDVAIKEIRLNQHLDSLYIGGVASRIDAKPIELKVVGLDKITTLNLFVYNPKTLPLLLQDIPCAVKSLEISGSDLPNINPGTMIDYTKVKGLRVLVNDKYISNNTRYPKDLDSLTLTPDVYIDPVTTLDLSEIKLEKCSLSLGSVTNVRNNEQYLPAIKLIKMPTTLKKLDLSQPNAEVIDLTGLDNLSFLKLYDDNARNPIKRIIFPKNLKRSNFKGEFDFVMKVDKTITQLVNYPKWLKVDEYGNDVPE